MSPKKKVPKEEPKAAAKRKAEAEPKAAPEAKGAKKEEPKKAEPKKEEPKKEEPPKKEEEAKVEDDKGEKEKDAEKDKRTALKGTVAFDPVEATLNVVPALGGKMLMSLSDAGMQFFIGGARANTGIKAGRYAYEVKAVQSLSPWFEKANAKGRAPNPRQLLRVGFSVAGSSLLLGDGEGSISFDGDGQYNINGVRNPGVKFMERDAVITVVLNLDKNSPNADTISLFKNGERIVDPKPLPENLKGKTLFPHVSFRNVSLHVNFGPSLMKELSFKCRSLQSAAQADCEVNPITPPKDGKYEIVLPVGFPNEGTFDWLDSYLEANPKYVELSDRKIQDWAKKSGMWQHNKWPSSRDKPEYAFGMPAIDDLSVTKILRAVAPIVPRDFVVMEVKANLISEERKTALKRFNYPCFKKIAHVVMGKPNDEWKKVIQSKILKTKQEKADAMWRAKKAEAARKKQIAARQKQLTEAQEAAKKQKEEEAKAKADAAKTEEEKKAEADKKEEVKAEDGDKKDEDMKPAESEEKKDEAKEETKEEEVKKEEAEEKKEEEEEEEETEPPQVELDEKEQEVMFMPSSKTPDLTDYVLNSTFGKFSIPEKDEGFDLIRYEWEDADGSSEYLKKWVLERKLMSRVDDLKPGEDFKKKMAEFDKLFKEWQDLQKEHKSKKKAGPKDDKEEEDDKKVDDIFSVENVKDMGNGEPLFANFEQEDWALMTMRVEMHHLVTGFKTDTNDPDREGIHETLLTHYYSTYHSKVINAKTWGCETHAEMLTLIKDTVEITPEKKILSSTMKEEPDNFDIFVKLTEENRRERQRRIDAGDETARLKYSPPAPASAKPAGTAGGKEKGGRSNYPAGGMPIDDAPKGGKDRGKDGKGGWKGKGGAKSPYGSRGTYGKPYGKEQPPMAP